MLPGMASLMLSGGYVPSDPDAVAYFAAMPAQPSDRFKRAVNDFIVGCKADGVWTLFDRFALLCLDTAQLNRVDMRYPSKLITETTGGTYTPGKGWKGNGTSAFLSFGVQLSYNAGAGPADQQATTNAAHMGGYVNVAGVAGQNQPLLGTTRTSSPWNVLNLSSGSNLFNTAVNGPKVSRSTANVTGLFTATRTSSTSHRVYYGDAILATESTTSAGNDTSPIMIGAERTIYTTQQIALAYMGGGLSQANMTAINQRIMTMLTAMGAA